MPVVDDGNIAVHGDNLESWLHDYASRYDFQDLKKCSQNQWHGAMTYIYNHVYKGTRLLRAIPYAPVDNARGMVTSHNAWDVDKLYSLLEWYTTMCDIYDKAITIRGYCNLSGVSKTAIYAWLQHDRVDSISDSARGLSVTRWEFSKKIRELEEDSLTAIGITGKRIPTGTLEALNYNYGHNMPGVSREISSRRRTPDEIAASHGVALENRSVDALPSPSFVQNDGKLGGGSATMDGSDG